MSRCQFKQERRKKSGKISGQIVIMVALAFPILLAIGGLAIDIAHVYYVRGELQNAADAAALAGAMDLYPSISFPAPNWAGGETAGTNGISLNKADGATLTDGQVQEGYWNLGQNPAGLQPQTITPRGHCSITTSTSCTANADCPSTESCLLQDVPAVRVAIGKSPGSNGGPVTTILLRIIGWKAFNVNRDAIATSGAPESVPAGGLFPLALTSCMVNSYFSLSPLPTPPSTCSATNPATFPCIDIDASYPQGGTTCGSGQWTSFQTDNNDVTTMRSLIANGNPTPLSVGDPVWIQPGVKDAVYQSAMQASVDTWITDHASSGDVALFPVVSSTSDMTTHAEMTLTGFAAFKIDGYVKSGTTSYVYGHFVDYYTAMPGSLPGGPSYNAAVPPVLVK